MRPRGKVTMQDSLFKEQKRDFPGGPEVKTLPSNAGDAGSNPDWRAKIPHASWLKNLNPEASL